MSASISVIIPTIPERRASLLRCVEGVTPQLRAGDRVIASFDGGDAEAAADLPRGVETVGGARGGPASSRNRALELVEDGIVLFLNDDVEPAANLLDAHRHAHDRSEVDGPALIGGDAPWATWADESVLDAMVRQTPLVFFYGEMRACGPSDRDWGFRHAWTLNLSAPRSVIEPFDERLRYAMFDDLEWAHRVCERWSAPVRFCREAVVTHRHRYPAEAVVRRELLLGHQLFVLESINPACAAATFGERYRELGGGETAMVQTGFASLHEASQRSAAGPNGGAEAERLFERCRAWRDAARRLGYDRARRGDDVETLWDEFGAAKTTAAFLAQIATPAVWRRGA